LFDLLAATDSPSIDATCIDIDPESLKYSRDMAEKLGVSQKMTFAQENAIRLALGRGELALAPQDLIYSLGLIDYLQDDLVVALLGWIYQNLRQGGLAVLGNFDVSSPDRAFADHILEWELIYRSPEDLRRLFRASRFGDDIDVRIEHESTGVQLFAFARRIG
jgi:extracellular factor (EF) 3-hydroxypalmitic acid methyl ester biosynthesis protein